MKWNSNLYDDSHHFVSKYGQSILSYLKPQKNEIILDLGCGTGDLTNKISLAGAHVTGVDSSSEMIKKAKLKYPEIDFNILDVRELPFDCQFDAIFSNAVLHWIPEKEKVIEKMYKSLKKGGRIVLEFGGKGCVKELLMALKEIFIQNGYNKNAAINLWYYPTIGEYTAALEKQNFKVSQAECRHLLVPLLLNTFTLYVQNIHFLMQCYLRYTLIVICQG